MSGSGPLCMRQGWIVPDLKAEHLRKGRNNSVKIQIKRGEACPLLNISATGVDHHNIAAHYT